MKKRQINGTKKKNTMGSTSETACKRNSFKSGKADLMAH